MYGFPVGFDYSVFLNKVVEKVVFMERIIWIVFDEDLSVGIESSYSHQISADDEEIIVTVPPEISSLMQLAGKVVESAGVEDAKTLTLRFQSGHVLRCYDDSDRYECIHIVEKEKHTVI